MTPISLEGQTLGKYRILEPLGRGGMAQVYKAYHPQLDRYVAIKVLRSDLVEEAEFLSRFRREARAVAALRHPNVVQVYDFDTQDDLYYMVMELLEGDTLKAHLNAFRTHAEHLPLGELMRILCDVLNGLAYAHGEGIIHRDLKPANIMLTKRGQAVLTDFGIAQIIGGTQYTISGTLMGTLNYMAPEQGLHGKCDMRSDIYSLGIVYFEMLTGKVPFDADTPLAILMKHLNDPLPLPHKFDPSIAEPLERVALKMLAKNPEDRYQSAVEVSEALAEAAQEAGIEIPSTVSLPQMTPLPPVQPRQVAVFSGTARELIPDKGFASGDTDVTLGEKISQPGKKAGISGRTSAGFQVPRPPFTPPLPAPPFAPFLPKSFPETIPEGQGKKNQQAGQAALYSIGWIVLVNIALLWASGVFGWKVFGYAWPMELISAGTLLAAIMAALSNPWILIPAGITLGNGLIFSYYSLTGWWRHWIIFWPLEPILIGICIVGAALLHRQGLQGRSLSRRIGLLLTAASVLAFIPILALSILLP